MVYATVRTKDSVSSVARLNRPKTHKQATDVELCRRVAAICLSEEQLQSKSKHQDRCEACVHVVGCLDKLELHFILHPRTAFNTMT